MARVSPLAELYLRLGESRKESFSKEDVTDIIREILPYEKDCFNEAFEAEDGMYDTMFNTDL